MEFYIAYETPDGSYTPENLTIIYNGTTCFPLSKCIEEILIFSDKNPNHFPINILIDPDYDQNHSLHIHPNNGIILGII